MEQRQKNKEFEIKVNGRQRNYFALFFVWRECGDSAGN